MLVETLTARAMTLTRGTRNARLRAAHYDTGMRWLGKLDELCADGWLARQLFPHPVRTTFAWERYGRMQSPTFPREEAFNSLGGRGLTNPAYSRLHLAEPRNTYYFPPLYDIYPTSLIIHPAPVPCAFKLFKQNLNSRRLSDKNFNYSASATSLCELERLFPV